MTLEKLKETVEKTLSVEIGTKNSTRQIVDARRIFTMIAFELGSPKLREVGDILGKGHTMTIHYRETGRELLEYDKGFIKKFITVCKEIDL